VGRSPTTFFRANGANLPRFLFALCAKRPRDFVPNPTRFFEIKETFCVAKSFFLSKKASRVRGNAPRSFRAPREPVVLFVRACGAKEGQGLSGFFEKKPRQKTFNQMRL